jgi:hypothetical protein
MKGNNLQETGAAEVIPPTKVDAVGTQWVNSLDHVSRDFLRASRKFAAACSKITGIPPGEVDGVEARILTICGQMVGLAQQEVMKAIHLSDRDPN